jgi:hypothetical protein
MSTLIIVKNGSFISNSVGFQAPIMPNLQAWFYLGGANALVDLSPNKANGTFFGAPTVSADFVTFGGPSSNSGNGQWMQTSVMDTGSSMTFYAVARSPDVFTSGPTEPHFISNFGTDPNYANIANNSPGEHGVNLGVFSTSGGAPQANMEMRDTVNSTGTSSGTSTAFGTPNVSIAAATGFHFYAGVVTAIPGGGVTRTIYDMTDNLTQTGTTAAPGTRAPNATNAFRFGQSYDGNGGICDEAFGAIYNAAHNLTQIGVVYASVKNYLAAQRGIVC